MLKYKGIVCLSQIDWNYLKQRVHYLMTGLAEKGLQVLFIENTGVRTPRLSDLSRVMHRIKCSTGHVTQDIPPGVKIFSPLAVPLPYSSIAIRYNRAYICQHIKKFLHANKLQPSDVIFWSCLPTPVALSLMKSCAWGATVYDIVSDPKYIEPRLGPSEQLILKLADYTIFASATLCDQYHNATKNPLLFEDGFNLELIYSTTMIPEIEQLPRPRLLYIGGINKKFQVEVITELAHQFKGGSIILVGPLSDGVEIPPSKNIHIYPPCNNYNDLAGFLRAADVGLIPYVQDRYAGAMHPAKINEYLVFGLPVVATSTPELERLAKLWGDGFFYLYKVSFQVVEAVKKALLGDNEALKIRRKSLTFNNKWKGQVEKLLAILEQDS